MDNIKFIYTVDSDIDDELLYAEFETKDAAIAYAMRNLDKLPFVTEVEIETDSYSGIEDALSYNTIWDHTMAEGATEEPDDDYWNDLATMYDDTDKHDLGDTTWFESMDNLVETLEDNEDEVECKECFDLFPKTDCIKLAVGYVCPTCAECGTVSEDEVFKIDFPEYEKFSGGNDMIPEDPMPADPTPTVEPDIENDPISDPEEVIENDSFSTPEEAIPFLVVDEEEAIAGYEKAAEVVEDSDLENKEEILDTIEHIKKEEEEHIEELTDLVEPTEEEVPEDSENENDPVSEEEEVEEIEDPEAEPIEEAMSDFQRKLIDRLPMITKDEFQQKLESGDSETIFTGDPREIGIRSRTYEASYEDGKYVVSFWDETYNEDFTDSEVVEEFDNMDGLWAYMITFMEDDDFSPEYNYLAEELTEHVNQENPAIESDQELEGTDNAVVDCKIADVVTHSEDEKPLQEKFGVLFKSKEEIQEFNTLCNEIGIVTGEDLKKFMAETGAKEGNILDYLRDYRDELGDGFKIEEKLTEAKRDPFHEAIFEAIDYLTEFSDIFPVPGNIGANNWEELKDDINYGLSSDFEIAEILMEYLEKDIAVGEKHPEIFEDDPQSELTLETYNRLKRAYDRAVADYEAANPEDFEELDESAILAAAASGVIVDVVKRIFDKVGDHKKKSKWIDFRKHVIEKTPEGQINIWNHDSEQVASDLKTVVAAKEKIKELNQKAKEDKRAARKNKNKPTEVDQEQEEPVPTQEALTEDSEPLSKDPKEKPSKDVQMANTQSTSGMNFEDACKMFGIEIED